MLFLSVCRFADALLKLYFKHAQEHDMSDDLLNQHAAISDLQQSEEVLVDHHKAMNEFLVRFLPESKDLYSQTNYVAYDQDGEFHVFIN